MPTQIEDIDDLDDGSAEIEPKVETKVDAPDETKVAIAELARHVTALTAPKEEKPTELTQEQKNELWAVYDPKAKKPDFMRKFFRLNPEATDAEEKEAEEMFADMHKGIMKQAMTGARNLLQIELQKRDSTLKELQDYVSEQRGMQTKDRFLSQYPALGDAKYAKILSITARDLASGTYANENEYFKALAEGAAETLTSAGIVLDLGAGKTKTKPTGTTPRVPRTNAGGTGGAGGTGSPGPLTQKGDATDDFLADD